MDRAALGVSDERYEFIAPTTRRQLTEQLSERAAIAAYEFIIGPLLGTRGALANSFALHWPTDTSPAEGPTGRRTASMMRCVGSLWSASSAVVTPTQDDQVGFATEIGPRPCQPRHGTRWRCTT